MTTWEDLLPKNYQETQLRIPGEMTIVGELVVQGVLLT